MRSDSHAETMAHASGRTSDIGSVDVMRSALSMRTYMGVEDEEEHLVKSVSRLRPKSAGHARSEIQPKGLNLRDSLKEMERASRPRSAGSRQPPRPDKQAAVLRPHSAGSVRRPHSAGARRSPMITSTPEHSTTPPKCDWVKAHLGNYHRNRSRNVPSRKQGDSDKTQKCMRPKSAGAQRTKEALRGPGIADTLMVNGTASRIATRKQKAKQTKQQQYTKLERSNLCSLAKENLARLEAEVKIEKHAHSNAKHSNRGSLGAHNEATSNVSQQLSRTQKVNMYGDTTVLITPMFSINHAW